MRSLLLLSLLLAATPTALAASTPYDIPPGQQQGFLITGDSPTLHAEQGNVIVLAWSQLAPGVWSITLACSTTSPTSCTGSIES